jgi:hypothetical protein
VPGSGSVSYIQLTFLSFSVRPNPIGVWISMFDQNCLMLRSGRSSPPASSSSTLCSPEAVSRLASTHPALPAPTMM